MKSKVSKCENKTGPTTGTVMYRSPSGKGKWIRAVRDMIGGVAIGKTAEALGVSYSTAFNMRHKILLAMEQMEGLSPQIPTNASELDETYVLESLKGAKIPGDYHRSPRRHGSKARKLGLSLEHVCIRTAIGPKGDPSAVVSVSRATPSPDGDDGALKPHSGGPALPMGDGPRAFGNPRRLAVGNHANVDGKAHDSDGASRFHLLAKRYYDSRGGVATKYLSRYANLLARTYRSR
jgi:hypothetical protein